MPGIIKNTLLGYTPTDFEVENTINPTRIFRINNIVKPGIILYLCEREIRTKDNFALQFAIQKSKSLKLTLKIIHPKINYEHQPKQNFIDNQIAQAQKMYHDLNLDFQIIDKHPIEIIKKYNPSLLIIDFNPIFKRNYLKDINCKIYEIDGHNIVPARFVSNKQEYNAATLRRKIFYFIYYFSHYFILTFVIQIYLFIDKYIDKFKMY